MHLGVPVHAHNTVRLAKLALVLEGKRRPRERPTDRPYCREDAARAKRGRPLRHLKAELTNWRRTMFTIRNVCRFTEFCRVDEESLLGADAHLCRLWIGFISKLDSPARPQVVD